MKDPAPSQIIQAVADHYEITLDDIKGYSRRKVFSRPRLIAYKMLRDVLGASAPTIAHWLRRDNHTTVLGGIKSITNTMTQTERYDYEAILSKVYETAEIEAGGVFKSTRVEAVKFKSRRTDREG